ncbi:MAG: hypothetical protein AAGF12_00205, partial [Myxococcota bacterium]
IQAGLGCARCGGHEVVRLQGVSRCIGCGSILFSWNFRTVAVPVTSVEQSAVCHRCGRHSAIEAVESSGRCEGCGVRMALPDALHHFRFSTEQDHFRANTHAAEHLAALVQAFLLQQNVIADVEVFRQRAGLPTEAFVFVAGRWSPKLLPRIALMVGRDAAMPAATIVRPISDNHGEGAAAFLGTGCTILTTFPVVFIGEFTDDPPQVD